MASFASSATTGGARKHAWTKTMASFTFRHHAFTHASRLDQLFLKDFLHLWYISSQSFKFILSKLTVTVKKSSRLMSKNKLLDVPCSNTPGNRVGPGGRDQTLRLTTKNKHATTKEMQREEREKKERRAKVCVNNGQKTNRLYTKTETRMK